MSEGKEVYARIPQNYDGTQMDRGQIINLHGCRNDEKLLFFRYLLPFDPVHTIRRKCDTCGANFAGDMFYNMHKRKSSCKAPGSEITRQEQADLLEVEPGKMVLDSFEDSAGFRPPSLDADVVDV